MEDSTRLTDSNNRRHRHHHHYHHHHHHHDHDHYHRYYYHYRRGIMSTSEVCDDECSTDSGCSSGGSTKSGEHLSRHGSGEQLCHTSRFSKSQYYLNRLRGRSTHSQERLNSSVQKNSNSWCPEAVRNLSPDGVSPSYFSSPSTHSSSDNDSLNKSSKTETLKRAFQNLMLNPSKWDNKEKKNGKKSPKRILRSPVHYVYVRGLSGLPTQRVPRKSIQQHVQTCSCNDLIDLYR